MSRHLARLALLPLVLIGLAACGLMPDAQNQSFTVSGRNAVPPAAAKPFENTDPEIDAKLAKSICVDDVKPLDAPQTLPADAGSLQQQHVACQPYHPTLVAGVPLPSLW
jgi:hypothetical protein